VLAASLCTCPVIWVSDVQRGVGRVDGGVDVGDGVGERGNLRELRSRRDSEILVGTHAGIGGRFLSGGELRRQGVELGVEVLHRLREQRATKSYTTD
jgi:hypothetical protein